jgi:glycosyltransferase involved in cell wall biosynthesis
MKFAIISPVRNEEQYILTTIKCMISQSHLPSKWVIVNDGSTDKTEEIVRFYLEKYSFMKYISLKDRGYRKPAVGVMNSFYEGFNSLDINDYDIIAKFDGDLDFPSNMLETISNAFMSDAKLGVTGGTRYEKKRSEQNLSKVLVPKGFVGGPFKFYRKDCFKDIGGLIIRAGWDGVDTIKAQMKGWKTGEIDSLKIVHLKSTGTANGEGFKKAYQKYGDVSYYMGGYFWYFLVRAIMRSFEAKNPKAGYYMLNGYLTSKFKKLPRENSQFRKFLRRKQLNNITYWLKYIPKYFNIY